MAFKPEKPARTDWEKLRATSDDEIERIAAADEDNPPAAAIPKLQALCDAVQEGLDSGPPVPFNLQDILSEAKARKLQRAPKVRQ